MSRNFKMFRTGRGNSPDSRRNLRPCWVVVDQEGCPVFGPYRNGRALEVCRRATAGGGGQYGIRPLSEFGVADVVALLTGGMDTRSNR